MPGARSAQRQEPAGLERPLWPNRIRSDVDARFRIGRVLTRRSAVDDPARFACVKKGWALGKRFGVAQPINRIRRSGRSTKAADLGPRRALCQAVSVMVHRGRATTSLSGCHRRASKHAMIARTRHDPAPHGGR